MKKEKYYVINFHMDITRDDLHDYEIEAMCHESLGGMIYKGFEEMEEDDVKNLFNHFKDEGDIDEDFKFTGFDIKEVTEREYKNMKRFDGYREY